MEHLESKSTKTETQASQNRGTSDPKAESQANPRPPHEYVYIYIYIYHYLIIKSCLGGTPICPHWSSIFAARLVQIGQTMRICSQGLVNISENITCTTLAEGLGRWLALCGLQVTFEHRKKQKNKCKVRFFQVQGPSKLPNLLLYQFYVLLRSHTMVHTTYKTTFLPYFSQQEIASSTFHSRTSTNNSKIFQMCTAKAPQDLPQRAQRYDRNDDLSNGPSKSLAWVHQTSAMMYSRKHVTWAMDLQCWTSNPVLWCVGRFLFLWGLK